MIKTNQKEWHVYLIRCADNSIYCGISTDVKRRFQEHQNMGKKSAKYLRGRGPLQLVFQRPIGNRSLASQVEALMKTLDKSKKEQIISQQKLDLFIDIPNESV